LQQNPFFSIPILWTAPKQLIIRQLSLSYKMVIGDLLQRTASLGPCQ
jgi:hypothetical protein